jgi:hypothetical protein
MLLQADPSSPVTVRGPRLADFDFDLSSSVLEDTISPGTLTSSTVKDANISTSTTATVDRYGTVEAQFVTSFDVTQATFTNLDPSIGTLGSDNVVRRVADGTARILVRTPLLTRRVDVPVVRIGTTTVTLTDFVSGSLARNVSDAIDSRVAGKSQSAWEMFTTRDTSAGVYVRNASAWCADLDTTCIAANTRATLITPRHIYGVEHLPPGSTIDFVTAGNVRVTRTVIDSTMIGPANASDSYATDIWIGRLDSDVPNTITPAKVLPTGVSTWMPGLTYGVPALATNQFKQAMVHEWYSRTLGFCYFRRPILENRKTFHTPVVGFDSGSPIFLIVNGVAVLLTGWTRTYSGVDIRLQLAAINAAITSLGGGGSLATADLSGFPTYP